MSGPGSKRAAGDGGSGPPEKKANREEKTTTTLIEPIRLGGISSTEEMDLKVLQFKNKKLAERLEQRQAFEDELRERIEKLEKRQATDDATLLIVNRYWSQLDENVQVLLRGYDGDCEPPPPAAPAAPSAEEPRPEPTGLDPENTASPSTEGPDRTEMALPVAALSTPWKAGGLLLNEPALSFLATLASSSSEEIELQLQERMEFSKAAVSRVVEVSNKIHRRTEELCQKIHARADLDQLDEALKSLNKELMRENQRLQDLAMQLQEKHHKISLEYTELQDKVTSSETKVLEMETTVEDLQWDIEKLRKREQKLNKHLAEALEQVTCPMSKASLSSSPKAPFCVSLLPSGPIAAGAIVSLPLVSESLSLPHPPYRGLAATFAHSSEHLGGLIGVGVADSLSGLLQLNSGYYVSGSSGGFQGGQITLSMQKFEMLNAELEENQELANSRMAELEKLQQELQQAVRTNEKLKVALRSLPEEAVKETLDYKVLQSQFSLLYNESLQVKTQLDEARALLLTTKNSHLRHIEHMESDELNLQKKLRTEVIQLEDTLAQVRKEYEMLRIEFEQNLAANEQAGPINREMRHLISSLQNHNHQLKGDVQRYKRKLREVQAEINKIRMQSSGFPCGSAVLPPAPGPEEPVGVVPTVAVKEEEGGTPALEVKKEPKEAVVAVVKKEEAAPLPEGGVKKEEEEPLPPAPQPLPPPRIKEPPERPKGGRGGDRERSRDRDRDGSARERDRQKSSDDPKKKDSDLLKQLRIELKKAQESQKEMKLLLDMYKSAPKEQRDKVQLMAAEKKTKAEVEELRGRVRELEEKEKKESKKMADEDALRKIKLAEEQIEHLQKKLAATKQEEEALLSEMDVTGQAFEDMQEQNMRLMQQLREKDDANFKLMSERIKSNQIHKLLREEKDELADQVLALKSQVDAQLLVVQKLEEKERVLQGNLGTVEKELTLRSQALELNKRKAVEAAQLAEDLKVQQDHVQCKLKEIQACMAENRAAKEKESFNLKRAQEDISRLRRKLEKQKKVEVYADADEILQEEIKEYKAKLTCPCCNTRKKDAVLTKCFHVFCFDCVKTRYDTRQRKCPKCNAAFGANDFHRIYIS
ncbi:E3 ubiquitin-protein ligase BRE1B isoform X1 [Dermochelys coriacea]|uniref:E3 ubiquitin-protein ligase BRE1B isoform X1 n=1 Tax=Dermochelys coriacea TaxID=27794 RepID=UPI001CA8F98A|nr:E3 ubiquitin-protein ligase BRE1B isoform X1 [Dermochelys coriacea]